MRRTKKSSKNGSLAAVCDVRWLVAITDCVTELSQHKIQIAFVQENPVLDSGDIVAGYYDPERRLIVARGFSVSHPAAIWGGIFLHEYCHFKQQLNKTPAWVEFNRKTATGRFSKGMIIATRDYEEECERMVVDIMKKYGLDSSIPDYIKDANVYIFFHTFLLECKRFIPIKSLVGLNMLVKDEFYDDYTSIPGRLRYQFKRKFLTTTPK